jgi:hypothetical protein
MPPHASPARPIRPLARAFQPSRLAPAALAQVYQLVSPGPRRPALPAPPRPAATPGPAPPHAHRA